MIVTDDESLYTRMDSLRNVGRIPGGAWYEHHVAGCNYRITQFQAALLSRQLRRLDEQTRLRDRNGRILAQLLSEIDGITPLRRDEAVTLHPYHLFIFRYDTSQFNGLSKSDFAAMLSAEGVPSFMGYPEPLYKQPMFQRKDFLCYAIPDHVSYEEVCCPVSERACYEEGVWILQHAMLGTTSDMEDFARAIVRIRNYVR